jgi:hypothetical protein
MRMGGRDHRGGVEAEATGDRMEGNAHIVQIDIDAAKMGQHKIADGVGPLNGLRIVVEGVEEPGVFGCDQLA